MEYPINKNGMYVLSIWDQEELHNAAEEVIVSLRYRRYCFDGEGNYIMDQLSKAGKSEDMDDTVG